MAGQLPVYLREYGKLGIVDLAVDIYWNQFSGRLLDFCEEFPDTGGLPGTREPTTDAVEWPASPKARLDLEREFPHLGLAVIELLGDIIDLEDLRIAEQGLIPHQDSLLHDVQHLIYRLRRHSRQRVRLVNNLLIFCSAGVTVLPQISQAGVPSPPGFCAGAGAAMAVVPGPGTASELSSTTGGLSSSSFGRSSYLPLPWAGTTGDG